HALNALPKAHGARPAAAAYCPCFSSRPACDQFPNSCEWKIEGKNGLCVPVNKRTKGFEGRNSFTGQKLSTRRRERRLRDKKGGAVYVDHWRIPNIPLNPYPWPHEEEEEEEIPRTRRRVR